MHRIGHTSILSRLRLHHILQVLGHDVFRFGESLGTISSHNRRVTLSLLSVERRLGRASTAGPSFEHGGRVVDARPARVRSMSEQAQQVICFQIAFNLGLDQTRAVGLDLPLPTNLDGHDALILRGTCGVHGMRDVLWRQNAGSGLLCDDCGDAAIV